MACSAFGAMARPDDWPKRRPRRIAAACLMSSMRPPPCPPSSAHWISRPARSPTGCTLPSVGEAATCGSSPLTSYVRVSLASAGESERTTSNGRSVSCDMNWSVLSSGSMKPHLAPTSMVISGNSQRSHMSSSSM